MPIALAWAALRRHALIVACTALAAGVSTWLLSALIRTSKALRRHPFTVRCTPLLLISSARFVGALARASISLRHHPFSTARIVPLAARVVDALELTWKAVRRHRLSLACTALLVTLTASLVGVSVPVALLFWALASVASLEAWRTLESFILARLGCRPPSHLERERLDPALGSAGVEVLVFDAAEPWLGRGLRTLVLSRALLDLLEDRALTGLLAQAGAQVRIASLPGELVVWLGTLPLLSSWYLSRGLVQLGRVLAIAVGASLVLPLALWPGGYTRWIGRLFGAAIVGLLGAALLSSGLSAAGLGLLLTWALVPGLHTLLNWETRQAESAADDSTLAAGLGWELVEALETLAWAASVPAPAPPLGWLCRLATPLTTRADRIWHRLAQP